jgi:hypothetical protein
MSREEDREKRTKRFYQDQVHINKQVKIARQHGMEYNDELIREPHRLNKHHAMDCGNPGCPMCSNPRKLFKEKTIQEKSFSQTEKWQSDD